jgi:hypothetical protein
MGRTRDKLIVRDAADPTFEKRPPIEASTFSATVPVEIQA